MCIVLSALNGKIRRNLMDVRASLSEEDTQG